jgi:hypothetical protein
MRGGVDHVRRKDLLVIKAMLEHGELVWVTLDELYKDLLKIEEEGLPPDPPAEASGIPLRELYR